MSFAFVTAIELLLAEIERAGELRFGRAHRTNKAANAAAFFEIERLWEPWRMWLCLLPRTCSFWGPQTPAG